MPSGRYQARYIGPDGQRRPARTADGGPLTFDTKGDADDWLALRHSEILRDEWLPPAPPMAPPVNMRTYADAWLAQRPLQERSREHYEQLLRDHVYPMFGDTPVRSITPAEVRTWHAAMGQATGPTARAHAYDLLRSIMKTAMDDELIAANPCRIRGAGQVKRAKKIRPATLAELEAIVSAMPPKYQLMTLLAAWLALRFGELAELRRSDIDTTNGLVHIRRGTPEARRLHAALDLALPPRILDLDPEQPATR